MHTPGPQILSLIDQTLYSKLIQTASWLSGRIKNHCEFTSGLEPINDSDSNIHSNAWCFQIQMIPMNTGVLL